MPPATATALPESNPFVLAHEYDIPSLDILRQVAPISPMPPLDFSARGVAYHEAGHAVLLRRFGVPITGARINPISGDGKVNLQPLPPGSEDIEATDTELQRSALRLAAMYMGGVAAQVLKDGICHVGVLLGNSSDWVLADRVLDEGGVRGSATGRLFYVQRLALACLTEEWRSVVAVAEALAIRETLNAEEIAVLCNGGNIRSHA